MAYKRKRVYAPRRYGMKKRKSSYKRRANRPRKAVDFTSLNTRGTAVGFRTKKTSRRTFLKHLWDSTLFTTHWRSVFTAAVTRSTPASNIVGTLTGTNLYKPAAGPFFSAAGGALPVDISLAIPQFNGNVVLRGGIYEYSILNNSTTDMKIKLFMLTTTNSPDFSFEPASNPFTQWDPSSTPDFTDQIGKVWATREVLLEGGNVYTYRGRFKMQKIDVATYILQGKAPLIYSLVNNVGTTVASQYVITTAYNVSFSGDGQ